MSNTPIHEPPRLAFSNAPQVVHTIVAPSLAAKKELLAKSDLPVELPVLRGEADLLDRLIRNAINELFQGARK